MGKIESSKIQFSNLEEHPEFIEQANNLNELGWKAFLNNSYAGKMFWDLLFEKGMRQYQFIAFRKNELLGVFHSLPIWWDGTIEGLPAGWDDGFSQAFYRFHSKCENNTMMAVSMTINPEYVQNKIASLLFKKSQQFFLEQQYKSFIFPVRPILKCKFPEINSLEYFEMKNSEGKTYDPWLRFHLSNGATFAKVAHKSMITKGTLEEWEEWLGQNISSVKETETLIEGGNSPLKINLKENFCLYEEDNFWCIYFNQKIYFPSYAQDLN